MIDTYRAGRRLEMKPKVWREPGELVPEAHTWLRLDSFVHTGYLDDAQVSVEDFKAAIATYCPELSDRLLELTGADPDVILEGGHKTPRRRPGADPVIVPLKEAKHAAKDDGEGETPAPAPAKPRSPSARRKAAAAAS